MYGLHDIGYLVCWSAEVIRLRIGRVERNIPIKHLSDDSELAVFHSLCSVKACESHLNQISYHSDCSASWRSHPESTRMETWPVGCGCLGIAAQVTALQAFDVVAGPGRPS